MPKAIETYHNYRTPRLTFRQNDLRWCKMLVSAPRVNRRHLKTTENKWKSRIVRHGICGAGDPVGQRFHSTVASSTRLWSLRPIFHVCGAGATRGVVPERPVTQVSPSRGRGMQTRPGEERGNGFG